jgi:hypothetical protein
MQIVTKEDLENFRLELFQFLKDLMKDSPVVKKKRYMKSEEVKSEFQVSDTKLYELRRKGEIPFLKVGGQYLYEYNELINHFQNNTK